MSSSPPADSRQPRRVSVACTFCRRRKIKCEPQANYDGRCKNCLERRQECVFVPVDQDASMNAYPQFADPSLRPSSPTSYDVYGHDPYHLSNWSAQGQSPASPGHLQPSGLPGYPLPGNNQIHPNNHSPVAYTSSHPPYSSQPQTHSMGGYGNANPAYRYSGPNSPRPEGGGQNAAFYTGTLSPTYQQNPSMPANYCNCVVGYVCQCYPGYQCQCPNARPSA